MFDLNTQLKVMKRMKAAVDKEGLQPYLMIQALGWLCPEVENTVEGYVLLPESPFGIMIDKYKKHHLCETYIQLSSN